MGMTVNTNLSAVNAQRNLANTQNDLSKSLEKLSSGLRINRAADDAAGLAISEGLRSQVNGYTVAARNAQDGISVIQTAEGSLTEVHSILQRMRDLAVQAGNDSNNENGRDAITKEVTQLTSELTRISQSSNFNGIKLLDGSAGDDTGVLTFQVGADGNASSQISVDLDGSNIETVVNALKGLDAEGVAKAFQSHDGFKVDVSAADAEVTIGTGDKTHTFTIATGTADVLAALNAGVGNDFTVTDDGAGGYNVVANFVSTAAVDVSGTNVTVGAAGAARNVGVLDFTTATGAQSAINVISEQITSISSARADLGALQNRFESAINSLNVGRENLTAAESRIRDVDMAAEMVKFTRSNILSQAGTSMLAQANQSNQGVLQLLR